MKHLLLKLLTVTLLALTCSVTLCAQDNNRQRISREELALKQARHIAHAMAFDDATTRKFTHTYCQCQKEIWALGPRKASNRQGRQETDSEDETEQALQQRFEHSQKLLDIRRKYHKVYSEFLTARQLKRVYELERAMMKRLSERNAHNKRPKS